MSLEYATVRGGSWLPTFAVYAYIEVHQGRIRRQWHRASPINLGVVRLPG